MYWTELQTFDSGDFLMLDQLNNKSGFFTDTLAETDAELFASIAS